MPVYNSIDDIISYHRNYNKNNNMVHIISIKIWCFDINYIHHIQINNSILSSSKITVMKRSEIRGFIKDLKNGSIYSVTFVKKDGSIRVMNGIKGTSKGVNGHGMNYDQEAKGLMSVYDMQLAKKFKNEPTKCWRSINIVTVTKVKAKGEIHLIED